jgi:hypothetical protein
MSRNNLINLHDFSNANMKWFSFRNLLIMLTSINCNSTISTGLEG